MSLARTDRQRIASPTLMQQLIIVVAAAAMYFANLGAAGLWDLDEALYSSIAREWPPAGIGSCRGSMRRFGARSRR